MQSIWLIYIAFVGKNPNCFVCDARMLHVCWIHVAFVGNGRSLIVEHLLCIAEALRFNLQLLQVRLGQSCT